jgi:hypothetical protein
MFVLDSFLRKESINTMSVCDHATPITSDPNFPKFKGATDAIKD